MVFARLPVMPLLCELLRTGAVTGASSGSRANLRVALVVQTDLLSPSHSCWHQGLGQTEALSHCLGHDVLHIVTLLAGKTG